MAGTHATCSIETKIQNFLNLRDTSAEFISSLAQLHDISGASTSRLSQAFRGRDLPEETAKPLGQMIDDLESYCQSMAPVPIALRNAVTIKTLLDSFRRRRDEQVKPTPFAVIYIGAKLFKQIRQSEIETTYSFEDCAAFQDRVVAHLAAKILDGKTNEHLRVASITNEVRAAETIFSQLVDFGFEQ